jgi:hypothetical protein
MEYIIYNYPINFVEDSSSWKDFFHLDTHYIIRYDLVLKYIKLMKKESELKHHVP